MAETARVLGTDPFGYTNSVVWRATNTDPNPGNSDGGWETGNFAIDNSKLYRFSVWTKRNTMTSGGLNLESGSFYLGHYGRDSTLSLTFSITKSNGVPFNNPYFHVTPNPNPSDITSIQAPFLGGLDVWTLVVGHVWPVGTGTGFNLPGTNINGLVSNTNHPDSGVWTRSSGKIGNPHQVGTGYGDCVWYPSAVFANHRAYLFYAADLTSVQSFIYPRVDIVDGLEPTIQELLAGSEPVRDLSPKANTIYPFGSSNFDKDGRGLVFSLSERDIVGGTMSSTFSANSISVWFCPTNTILTSTTAQALVQFGPIDSAAMFLYLGEVTGGIPNEIISIVSTAGNTMTYVTTASVPSLLANTWYNVVANFNGAKYDIYLNGVSMATVASAQGNTVPTPSVNYVAIGGNRYTGTQWGSFLDGKIGSVLVYERSLEPFEIISNYNATKQKYGVI